MTGKKGELKTGRILKGVGGFYYVEAADAVFECRARGKFRSQKITPFVGDFTQFMAFPDGSGYLLEILTRKNSFSRPPVANIDMLVITASAAPPVTDPFLIDRLVSVAVRKGIEPLLVFNKIDLKAADELFSIYSSSGIPSFMVSAASGEGCEELKIRLAGKLCAFSGNSGVGKSSVINTLFPELSLKTGSLNEKIGRGRHTTRHVEILRLGCDTLIADTPGFSSFDLSEGDDMPKEALASLFPEFRPFLSDCRFADCAHTGEEGCALKEALLQGKIHPSRYESYLKLYEKLSEIPPWQKKNRRHVGSSN